MHCLFALWSAYFYIFKDYFTLDDEYPTDGNRSTTLAYNIDAWIMVNQCAPTVSRTLVGTVRYTQLHV